MRQYSIYRLDTGEFVPGVIEADDPPVLSDGLGCVEGRVDHEVSRFNGDSIVPIDKSKPLAASRIDRVDDADALEDAVKSRIARIEVGQWRTMREALIGDEKTRAAAIERLREIDSKIADNRALMKGQK